MNLTKLVIHDEAILAMVNNPRGGIARKVNEETDKIVEAVQRHLSVPAVRLENGFYAENKAPGPPRWRTGRLHDSIKRSNPPFLVDGVRVAVVGTDAQNNGHPYGSYLLSGAGRLSGPYEFIPPGLIPE